MKKWHMLLQHSATFREAHAGTSAKFGKCGTWWACGCPIFKFPSPLGHPNVSHRPWNSGPISIHGLMLNFCWTRHEKSFARMKECSMTSKNACAQFVLFIASCDYFHPISETSESRVHAKLELVSIVCGYVMSICGPYNKTRVLEFDANRTVI